MFWVLQEKQIRIYTFLPAKFTAYFPGKVNRLFLFIKMDVSLSVIFPIKNTLLKKVQRVELHKRKEKKRKEKKRKEKKRKEKKRKEKKENLKPVPNS